jgi:hypothetical protein
MKADAKKTKLQTIIPYGEDVVNFNTKITESCTQYFLRAGRATLL